MAVSTATLIFRLEKEKRDEFMRLCESNGLSPSIVLRELVDYILRTRKVPVAPKRVRKNKLIPDEKSQEQLDTLKNLFDSMNI